MFFKLPIGLSGRELAPARARISFASRFDLVFDLVFSRLRFPGHVYVYITAMTCDECIVYNHAAGAPTAYSETARGKCETNGRQV